MTFSLLCLQPRLLILEGRAPPAMAGGRACRPGYSPPRCCSASRPIFRADGCSHGDRLPPPPVYRDSPRKLFFTRNHALLSSADLIASPGPPRRRYVSTSWLRPLFPFPAFRDCRERVQKSPCRARRALTSTPGTSSSLAPREVKPSQ